ncbi:hypothetical protein M501DRAFT_995034 [Patellaria atrata CBS 101060]|uniref:Uncharacterized protein n=1 Tax=Patellaria atrata CBS 101060 TaxID=1346257 RepID=A0A9P4S8E0_9PEZI|nr:hypothetical protein M501DRAFT_995034 [Patellaria atrata CBS 101060]
MTSSISSVLLASYRSRYWEAIGGVASVYCLIFLLHHLLSIYAPNRAKVSVPNPWCPLPAHGNWLTNGKTWRLATRWILLSWRTISES